MFKWVNLFPIVIATLMVAIFFNTNYLFTNLLQHGLVARSLDNWKGMFFFHFLHGNKNHLYVNVINLVLLMYLNKLWFKKYIWQIWFLSLALTSVIAWLFCRGNTMHIGASAWIYALFGFLFFSGLMAGNAKVKVASLVAGLGFGSMFWGILPMQKGISWDGHASGLAAGILLAFIFKNRIKMLYPKVTLDEVDKETDAYPDHYLPFDKSE